MKKEGVKSSLLLSNQPEERGTNSYSQSEPDAGLDLETQRKINNTPALKELTVG